MAQFLWGKKRNLNSNIDYTNEKPTHLKRTFFCLDSHSAFCIKYAINKYCKFCLFVCGISLTSGQLINELFPDCTRSCFSQVLLHRRGSDHIYEMRCLFIAVGTNAHFIVLPHWDNMS